MYTSLFERRNRGIGLLKIFTFTILDIQLQTIIWQGGPAYKSTANNWKYSSHHM